MKNLPDYLAAFDKKRKRVFVLATPNLSAVKIDNHWYYTLPLGDEELRRYELVTDLGKAQKLVEEAKRALKEENAKEK